jgi:hypothetical protein
MKRDIRHLEKVGTARCSRIARSTESSGKQRPASDPARPRRRIDYHEDMALSISRRAAMNVESIVGLVGLVIGLIILIGLSIFESREYRREHHGEGRIHHWLAAHHLLDWRHRH